jgi:cytochrome c biogenesis protein CcdA
MMEALPFAALAGVLSILSPCVLPLVPIVLGAAAAESRLGPLALAGGLALSFTAIGLFVATIGFAIGLNGDVFRGAGAILMVALGLVLLVPVLQLRFAAFAAPVGAWAGERMSTSPSGGAGGQFGIGLVLGAVWAPCVGPTLGAASVLAARGEDLPQVAAVMLAFGLGAAAPLLVLGTLSRDMLMRSRRQLAAAGGWLKQALGALLVAAGLLVLSGVDKQVEAWLVAASPEWLTALTTRF